MGYCPLKELNIAKNEDLVELLKLMSALLICVKVKIDVHIEQCNVVVII